MLAAESSPVSGLVFTVAVLATSMALVAALAWASRRLLGLSVGVLRALIAGLLGFATAAVLGQALRAAQPGHEIAFLSVALGVPLIVAMIFIVAAEALVPTGTGPGPVEVVRGTQRALARSRRYSQISRIAVRHGLGPYLRGRRQRQADADGGRAALAVSLRRALDYLYRSRQRPARHQRLRRHDEDHRDDQRNANGHREERGQMPRRGRA